MSDIVAYRKRLRVCTFTVCWNQMDHTHGWGGRPQLSIFSVSVCQDACVDTPWCVAIDYDPHNVLHKFCWLLNSTVNGPARNVVHYVLIRSCRRTCTRCLYLCVADLTLPYLTLPYFTGQAFYHLAGLLAPRTARTPADPPPPSVWPHLFCGAGHMRKGGESSYIHT